MTVLDGWKNFYMIVGSSAGALIGLQFVVITLIAGRPITRVDAQAGGAFATPTVVHFGVALLLSAVANVPWSEITTVTALWALVGLCGLVYLITVAWRMRAQRAYKPVFEDWLFHVLLPGAAYMTLVVSGCMAQSRTRPALFLVAASALVLLFIGIHNAWDAVMYHVFVRSRQEE